MKQARRITKEAGYPFGLNRVQCLSEGLLLGREQIVPNGRAAFLIDHFQHPTRVVLASIDENLDRHAVTADLLAEP